MADDTLNVCFGDISHGWLPITFTVAGTDTLVDASDFPVDPLSQLVSFARFILSTELGSRTAEFHLEPAYCVLTANKSDSLTVGIRLVQPSVNLAGSAVNGGGKVWRLAGEKCSARVVEGPRGSVVGGSRRGVIEAFRAL